MSALRSESRKTFAPSSFSGLTRFDIRNATHRSSSLLENAERLVVRQAFHENVSEVNAHAIGIESLVPILP